MTVLEVKNIKNSKNIKFPIGIWSSNYKIYCTYNQLYFIY